MRTFRLKKLVLKRPVVLGGETGLGSDSGAFGVIPGSSRIIAGRDRMNRKRISWDASPSPDVVGYRIYWAANKIVDFDSDFGDVGHVTSLTLPNDVPAFPRVTGRMEIGITALSRSGNESDMCTVAVFVDFARPHTPMNLKIEGKFGFGDGEAMKEAGCW
jgi:hypothetical protein